MAINRAVKKAGVRFAKLYDDFDPSFSESTLYKAMPELLQGAMDTGDYLPGDEEAWSDDDLSGMSFATAAPESI